MQRLYTRGLIFLLSSPISNGFCSPYKLSQRYKSNIFLSAAADTDAISKMRAGEIKKELESYGISTKSFLEKSELVEALMKARSDGLQPKESAQTVNENVSKESKRTDTGSREERIALELDKLKDMQMKATEMKRELESMGVSTASFFEKSEFAKALAEARVDGVKEEENAVEVEVLPKGDPGPKKRSDPTQQQSANANPFGGGQSNGSNPFGGGGMGGMEDLLKNMGGNMGGMGNMGNMGGMGGMADMFKNMAGGGSSSSPFGGGMPDMAKVQQMMQNPKIREVMAKAQNNPKIMSAVTECMSNPAAFAKYQNDPEIRDLINEIKPYI